MVAGFAFTATQDGYAAAGIAKLDGATLS